MVNGLKIMTDGNTVAVQLESKYPDKNKWKSSEQNKKKKHLDLVQLIH